MLRPEEFGAIGDGERDDTAALQAALSRAEGSGVRLQARPYVIRDTLHIPTNCVLEGRGVVILQKSDNRPILASLAWAGRGPTKGYTRILGVRLQGTGRGERQDGIVLHDYWSEIADVEGSIRADGGSCSRRRTSAATVQARPLSRTAFAIASSATPVAAPSSSASRRTASSPTGSFRAASRACTTAPASPPSPSVTPPGGSSTGSNLWWRSARRARDPKPLFHEPVEPLHGGLRRGGAFDQRRPSTPDALRPAPSRGRR
jgi:hypothetical protein